MGIKLNTSEFRQHLNRSTTQLESETIDKLLSARRNALQAQNRYTQRAPVVAWLYEHGIIGHHSHNKRSALNLGLAALFAITIISGFTYWQSNQKHIQSNVDIAILTDELPVNMYVD
ncbi:MAG: DUF3619 family protein [Sideroxydans sp.]|nr:DUF3619 family protein [Sideroxydans sp.]